MLELLQHGFMQNALIAAVLVNVACGIVGSYVVVKKIVSISGAISHAAFGGIGLGFFIGINPIVAAIPFTVLSAMGIGLINEKVKISEDTAIGILWSVGMAIGVIFIKLTPGYAPDLLSYLFGNILLVPSSDLVLMLILNVIIILTVLLFYREFLAVSFDQEFARVVGVPVKFVYILLLCIVALSVVVMIKVVGTILLIALLTVPAAISKQITSKMKNIMILSVILGIVFTISGLWLSYIFNLASGATIVLVLGSALFISTLLKNTTTMQISV
ncbi:MAG: metal ABC transporter permease [Methanobacteriaceae archaeon]